VHSGYLIIFGQTDGSDNPAGSKKRENSGSAQKPFPEAFPGSLYRLPSVTVSPLIRITTAMPAGCGKSPITTALKNLDASNQCPGGELPYFPRKP
jgi:hypothetical protein